MQAPFLESIRGVQIHIEVPEKGAPGRLVARRTVGSGAPNMDGLEETFVLSAANVSEFLIWLTAWLPGDHSLRWFRLGREADIGARVRLNPRQQVKIQT